MATLYLTEPQTLVQREGDTLVVHVPANAETKTPKRKVSVPLIKVDRVVVHGTATLTSPAIAALMERRADITFLNYHGQFQGHLQPAFTKNGQLRLQQAQAHLDWSRRHALAQAFVVGKLTNMYTLLLRANRKRQNEAISQACAALKQTTATAGELLPIPERDKQDNRNLKQTTATAGELLPDVRPPDPGSPQTNSAYGRLQGLEGNGTAHYFNCFQHILNQPELFTGRTRRPPRDPANALLSYGYTILLNQVISAICTVGLDPYIGYLHSSQYGKPALALDLMEEFRPLIVDSVVITLINTTSLTAAISLRN